MSRNVPHDFVAEELLLGSILHKPAWYFDVPATTDHFHNPAAQVTWMAIESVMTGVAKLPKRAELVSLVRASLRDSGTGDTIVAHHQLSPDEYLAMMLQRVVSRADLDTSWEKVELHQKQRASVEACRDYAMSVVQPNADIDAVASRFTERFSSIMQGRKLEYFSPAEIMSESLERARVMRETGVDTTRIATGVEVVDDLLDGGLSLGHYTVMAAKRKMGKSRLTLAMAFEMTLRPDAPWAVDYYSLENTAEDVGDLANAWWLSKPRSEFIRPTLFDHKRFASHLDTVADLKSDLRFFFGPQHTLSDIVRNTMARSAALNKPLCVFVDYLQEVDVRGVHSEFERVTAATRGLARMSRQHKCAVVAAAQFNREAGAGEPSVHQLRASGQIEQDVNELFIFHRAAEEEKHATSEQKRIGTLRLALNRHGPTDHRTVSCKLATLQFADYGGVDDF